MNKELKQYINEHTHNWSIPFILLAGTLVPIFFVLDYFVVSKQKLLMFLGLRLFFTLVAMVQVVILKKTKPGNYSFIHGYIASFTVSFVIVWMTVLLGGFNSAYYAGLNLVMVATNLILPWEFKHSIINSFITLFLYIFLNIIWGAEFEVKLLLNNLFFILGTIIIIGIIKFLHFNLSVKEFNHSDFLKKLQNEETDLFSDAARKVTKKDLRVEIQLDSEKQEENKLVTSFNLMMTEIRVALIGIRSISSEVSRLSKNIRNNTEVLLNGSQKQLTYTENSVSSISLMLQKIERNSSLMFETSTIASNAIEVTKRSTKILERSSIGVDNIKNVIEGSSKKIQDLKNSSEKISDIIQTIVDIAEKTNLLSLNASIEAARAGEQGKGFSIVAMEIGKLSEQTAEATQQTTSIIKNLSHDVREVIESFSAITSESKGIQKLVQETSGLLNEVHEVFNKMDKIIEILVKTGEEQIESGKGIGENIRTIEKINREFTASLAQINGFTTNLDELVGELDKNLSGFKLT
ncbi:MAG: hypothetical protein H7A25_19000 [Leptospiraceae bacterium]|nr:hypothetical protein [Leptospiraceae bacterium]